MQFKEKLVSQTWQNSKKPNFWSGFGWIDPSLGHQFFFRGFYLYEMLDIVAGYHFLEFQGKPMTHTQ